MLRIIRPTQGWKGINWSELFDYKDLLWFLTLRGIKAKYAQSIFGISWAIIQPLFSTLVFTLVFGRLSKMESNGVPYFLFSYVALVPWTFFANSLTESSNSLVANSAILTKVYFPRLVLPLSAIFSKTVDFLVSFALLLIFLGIYGIVPAWEVLLLPWMLLILTMTSLGVGLFMSALAVQYRDVKHALSFGVQLLIYASPVVYPTSLIPERWRIFYAVNPVVGVIEGFRSAFLSTIDFPYDFLVVGTFASLLLLLIGVYYFNKMERIFSDIS